MTNPLHAVCQVLRPKGSPPLLGRRAHGEPLGIHTLAIVELKFDGQVLHWRGPSPYHFVAIPERDCEDVRAAARDVSYGWGVVPVTARIGRTTFTTSLFPKDGGYLVPVKDKVRAAEGIEHGDVVTVQLTI